MIETLHKKNIEELSRLFESGLFDTLTPLCEELLLQHPNSLFLKNIFGNCLFKQGKFLQAVDVFREATSQLPQSKDTYNNLGVALTKLGNLKEALESFKKAVEISPNSVAILCNCGAAYRQLGQLDEAIAHYHKAIDIKPTYPEAHYNLGLALERSNNFKAALKCFDRTIELKAKNPDAHSARGTTYHRLGLHKKAVKDFYKATLFAPKDIDNWLKASQSISKIKFSRTSKKLITFVLNVVDHPAVRPSILSEAAISLLRCDYKFVDIVSTLNNNSEPYDLNFITNYLSRIPLLLKLLELVVITDLEIEKAFTILRSLMLSKVIRGEKVSGLLIYQHLAISCFLNEYVYAENNTEKKNLKLLESKVKRIISEGCDPAPELIFVLGSYRSLSKFPWLRNNLSLNKSGILAKVVKLQFSNVTNEEMLRTQIKLLTPIDSTSKLVQSQYEENPYPRWTKCQLNTPIPMPDYFENLRLKDFISPEAYSKTPRILIAGCGTGQHALQTATSFIDSEILAIDLSLASLTYAKRRAQELGVENITFKQADILKLKFAERKFDLIESVGVLHHMVDPYKGLKILASNLKKGGLMRVGLYSEIARKQIVTAREIIKTRGYIPSEDTIRTFRKEIVDDQVADKLKIKELVSWGDFYTLSEFRDLVFHEIEHRFTLIQINTYLDKLSLNFVGFSQINEDIENAFKNFCLTNNLETTLSSWNSFEWENPDTFKGMYDFWVQKSP